MLTLTLTTSYRFEFGIKKIDKDSVFQGHAALVSNGIQAFRGNSLTNPRTYRRGHYFVSKHRNPLSH
jgi:hypothetical protein